MAKTVGIDSERGLLESLLRDVSRSFYLTVRVLPRSIRRQIGLAYLLARTSDTIADTQLVPLQQRLTALNNFRERILGLSETELNFELLVHQQSSAAERILLERSEAVLHLLRTLTSEDLQLTQQVLATILSGQELDLRRFAQASLKNVIALQTEEELDDYTYRVAGCVGEFWTRMCLAHAFPNARLDQAALLGQAIRFGKGLQLVNILRDLPADLRLGRCYLPEQSLAGVDLVPSDLLEPVSEGRLRPLYNDYLAKAKEHLRAGWGYTNSLPWSSMRVRLACAWPILIGLRTLELLGTGPVLDPQHRIKISRAEVRKLLWRSVLYYPWPPGWRKLVKA